MRLRRPPSYWAVLLGALVVPSLAARAGLQLFRSVERAPVAVEGALRTRLATADALAAVASLESNRRGYAFVASPEQLHAVELDYARVHQALSALRRAAAFAPTILALVDSAEGVLGAWQTGLTMNRPNPTADAVRLDRRLLGSMRRHLQRVAALAERERQAAASGVRGAHERAELLWLAGSGVIVVALLAFVELAYRRRLRVAEAAREMDLLLSALPFTLLSLDREGRIRQATGPIHQVLGITRRHFLGQRLRDIVAGADRDVLDAALRTTLEDGLARQCTVVTPASGGPARALDMLLSPIREGAEAVGVSAVVHDVTGERTLRAQVLQSERLASVGALVAGIVHEMNNPLAAIASFAETIDRSGLVSEDRAAVDTIGAEAKRAAQIARNLLDFSRQQTRRYAPTNLAHVIERTVTLRRYELRVRGTELDVAVASDLPSVEGDPQQLQQVFLNLLVNAEDAVRDRPERRIAIRATAAGGRVRVTVEDSGPGVPEEKREAIFESFYTTKPEGQGTGLGLALSRGIVTEHHGDIHVERGALGGARFVVELPVLPDAGRSAPPAHDQPAAAHPVAVRGGKVLVVEDEPANRQALTRLLERLGHPVVAVADGQEALDALAREEFAVILADLHMPGLDGAGLYEAIAARWPHLCARMALVSGDAGDDPALRRLVERGCAMLGKPYDLAALQALVERLSTAPQGANTAQGD